MKKMMMTLGFVMVLLFGTAYVYAQGSAGHAGHHAGLKEMGDTGQAHKSLESGKGSFTPEQKAKFRELRRDFRRDNAQLIGSIVAKRIELQALWTDPKADSKAIMDKTRELIEVKKQLREKFTGMMLEARKLLTPEQIANLKPGWFWGKGHRHGHMMGRGRMMERGAMMGGMMGHGGMMSHGGRGGMMGHGGMMEHGSGMCR